MKERAYFVYMLASRRNGTLYTGVTNDVLRRTWQHKNDLVAGFTKKYGVHVLVWYELHTDIHEAIAREKQIKGWNRAWKIKLIEKNNSGWNVRTPPRQHRGAGESWVPFPRIAR